MSKSATKKLGTFLVLALLLAAVLGVFYLTSRTAVATTQAGVSFVKNNPELVKSALM
jgi:hypothetical protein